MRIGAYVTVCLLLGAGLFGLFQDWGLIDAQAPLWRLPPGDLSMMEAGVEAVMRDPWRFPLSNVSAFSFTGMSSIVYRDSIPAISLAVKALGLGQSVNPLGLTLFLSYLLQPVAFLTLLLALGVRRWEALILGAAIGCFAPIWPYRMQLSHIALASHFLILFALALAVRMGRAQSAQWPVMALFAIAPISLGFHGYLFAMILPIALAGFAARAAAGFAGIGASMAQGAGLIALCAATAWALGYGGPIASPAGFGVYSMNLASPFWPAPGSFTATALSIPVLDATGGQYEGMNYLGAGALLLVLCAAALMLFTRRSGRSRIGWPILFLLFGFFLFSLSQNVYFADSRLFSTPVPDVLLQVGGHLRASGRFFWPVGYLIVAYAIYRAAELPRRYAVLLLTIALAAQTMDAALTHRQVGAYLSAPMTPPIEPRRWEAALAQRDVALYPSYNCLPLEEPLARIAINQLSLAALRLGGRVEGAMEARARESCDANRQSALQGSPDPNRVNVIFTSAFPIFVVRRILEAQNCAAFELGVLCGAQEAISRFPAVKREDYRPPTLAPGALLRLAPDAPEAARLLGEGWRALRPEGVWSNAKAATLLFSLPAGETGDAIIEVDLAVYAPQKQPAQRIRFSLGSQILTEAVVDHGTAKPLLLRIARDLMPKDNDITLTATFPDAISPSQAGDWIDPLPLAVLLRSLRLRPAPD